MRVDAHVVVVVVVVVVVMWVVVVFWRGWQLGDVWVLVSC